MPLSRRNIKLIVVITGIFSIILVICLLSYATTKAEQWLCEKTVTMLSEEFCTKVKLDSLSINVVKRELSLYGFEMEDRKQEKMLMADTLSVRVRLRPLLHSQIAVNNVRLHGITAVFYKARKDTATNYQFVIDAIMKRKQEQTADKETKSNEREGRYVDISLQSAVFDRGRMKWDVYSEPVKGGDTIDANHFIIDDVHLRVDSIIKGKENLTMMLTELRGKDIKSGISLSVDSIKYHKNKDNDMKAWVSCLQCNYRDIRLGCERLALHRALESPSLENVIGLRMDSLTFYYNNGKPHKREGKTNRGYFDAGHLDVVADLEADIRFTTLDNVKSNIINLSVNDKASGLYVTGFSALLERNRDIIRLNKTRISLPNTVIKMDNVEGHLLRDGNDNVIDVRIHPFPLTANIRLSDIAKPFVPVLSDFTTPLNLSVTPSGTLGHILLDGIKVATPDKRLNLTAHGEMYDIGNASKMRLLFTDIHLDARRGIKEVMVGHFSKKVHLKMGQQMRKIGDIRYNGNMGVYYKRENFSGMLFTKYGNVSFAFILNDKTKEMTGTMSTKAFALGDVMNVKGLGEIKANASYSFNIATNRNHTVKGKGRLPIGWLKADIDNASFKKVNFSDISSMVHSDGITAKGEIFVPNKLVDLSVLFFYTQTDAGQDLKVKPKLQRHKKSYTPFDDTKKWKDKLKEIKGVSLTKKKNKRDKVPVDN